MITPGFQWLCDLINDKSQMQPARFMEYAEASETVWTKTWTSWVHCNYEIRGPGLAHLACILLTFGLGPVYL